MMIEAGHPLFCREDVRIFLDGKDITDWGVVSADPEFGFVRYINPVTLSETFGQVIIREAKGKVTFCFGEVEVWYELIKPFELYLERRIKCSSVNTVDV